MRKYRCVMLALALISASACLAIAPGTVELGVDMSAERRMGVQQERYTVNLPDEIRVGVFVIRNTSIVARLASAVVSTDYGQQSVNSYSLGAAYYVSKSQLPSRMLFEIMGLTDFTTGSEKSSQFGVGLGFGIESKVLFGHPRLEFVIEQWVAKENPAESAFKLLLGFSFYSRQ